MTTAVPVKSFVVPVVNGPSDQAVPSPTGMRPGIWVLSTGAGPRSAKVPVPVLLPRVTATPASRP